MKVLFRVLAVLFVFVALFLIYAVINALLSDEGARAGIAVLYVAISAVLTAGAVFLWRASSGRPPEQ